jgi:hypothetical protein
MGLFADNQRCFRSTVDGAVQAGPTKDKIWESRLSLVRGRPGAGSGILDQEPDGAKLGR